MATVTAIGRSGPAIPGVPAEVIAGMRETQSWSAMEAVARPAFTASAPLPDLIEEPENPDLHRQW